MLQQLLLYQLSLHQDDLVWGQAQASSGGGGVLP